MLFLQFHIGKDRYALSSEEVIEVLPLLDLKRIPKAPEGIAGAFNYRGVPVPVVDLNTLSLGSKARLRMNTRIFIVRHHDENGTQRPLGLIAEKVTETLNRDPKDFVDAGVTNTEAAYLGPVLNDENGLVQWVKTAQLLPQSVLDVLFKSTDSLYKEVSAKAEVTA